VSALIELIDDALHATKEAQRLPITNVARALLKDAENALHGAAKVCVVTPVPPTPVELNLNNAWAEHKRKTASDWRSIAQSWERVRDGARCLTDREDADHQMQHALLMAEANDQSAAELERGQ
jgi:hypothetical protein